MTPRERVWKVLNHQEADRTPIEMGSVSVSSMSYSGMEQLKQFLGLPGLEYTIDNEQCGLAYRNSPANPVRSEAVPGPIDSGRRPRALRFARQSI